MVSRKPGGGATFEVTQAELDAMKKKGLGLLELMRYDVDPGGPCDPVFIQTDHKGRVVQDYGPRYASEMWESAEKLRKAMERCHQFLRRCVKLHGPTGRPRWILTLPSLWGRDLPPRTWQDRVPHRAEREPRPRRRGRRTMKNPVNNDARAFPCDVEIRAAQAALHALERMLTRPPADLTPDELLGVRKRRASELVKAARQVEAALDDRRLVFRSSEPQPRPERTSYRSHEDNVFHPAPSSSSYHEHVKVCDRCAGEWARENPRGVDDRGANNPVVVQCEHGTPGCIGRGEKHACYTKGGRQ